MQKNFLLCLIISQSLWAQNPGDNLFLSPTVHTVKIYFSQPGWYDSLIAYKPLDIKMLGNVEIDGYYIDSVGIQFKGNSSFNVPGKKKSWKIDFNEFVSGQKFDGLKAINLNNGFKDPTFLREKITLDFCQKNGIPAPRCSYANVYVNDTLWGFYMMVEQVDKTFLKNWFPENEGNLFKGDPQGSLQWYGSSPSSYYPKYELKTNETANDWTDLVHLIDVINNKPSAQFYDSLESVLNTSNAIKAWAFDNLFANLDSYRGSGHNYYIYHNLQTNKFEWIEWDVNEAFGNFNMGMSVSQLENLSIFYIPSPPSSRPLTNKMLQNTIYKTDYINTLCQFVSTNFDTTYLYRKIDSLANVIRPYVYADPQKFYTNSQFETNIHSNITVGSFNIPGLKSFILNRRNSVVSQLAMNGCIMGISELSNTYDFQIYPNPCQSEFYISIPDDFNYSEFQFTVNDLMGKEVKSTLIKISDEKRVMVNLGELSSGVYFYSISSFENNNVSSGKLILIK
ncbi:MAG: hypothetical protein KatS3mg027_1226 [Bacteroidia bacterium]|nr:MAG: hypothetical protein KatS3mg027_1226 [Bacteroidia bacterium]